MEKDNFFIDDKANFKDEDVSIFKTGKGLNENVIREISRIKNESEFMLELRLKAYHEFERHPNPKFGPDLSFIDFDDYTYYTKIADKVASDWEEVPDTVRSTFNKLGIPEAEQKFLAGVSTQYESETVYSNMLKEVEDKGVIFLDTDTALKHIQNFSKNIFGKLVPYTDNKYAALNTACWSGGAVIYVPKGVKLEKPLQSYFRINNVRSGQFERTLIIVDDDASLNYVEGCTAPQYSEDSLHAAVVEIFVGKRAKCRYSTIQNWSTNILNLVTQRAQVEEDGLMEWVDGNVGSGTNMKYPCCVLKGDRAKGSCISIAVAGKNQFQDAGAKMIHIGKNTSSTIISKSIVKEGGRANYRGLAKINKNASHSNSHIECDTLMLDEKSFSDTIPENIVNNNSSFIEHEASVSKLDEGKMFYLMSRGLSEKDAKHLLVMGFIEPFSKELPMEYAVELNQLIKLDMEGSIG